MRRCRPFSDGQPQGVAPTVIRKAQILVEDYLGSTRSERLVSCLRSSTRPRTENVIRSMTRFSESTRAKKWLPDFGDQEAARQTSSRWRRRVNRQAHRRKIFET